MQSHSSWDYIKNNNSEFNIFYIIIINFLTLIRKNKFRVIVENNGYLVSIIKL